jgi:hypothetical protein
VQSLNGEEPGYTGSPARDLSKQKTEGPTPPACGRKEPVPRLSTGQALKTATRQRLASR